MDLRLIITNKSNFLCIKKGDKDTFRKAFAGATIHDAFNLLCVIVLLPLELFSGYLDKLSNILVTALIGKEGVNTKGNFSEPQLLNTITKPLTHLIIQLDSHMLEEVALNETISSSIIKHVCKKTLKNGFKTTEKCEQDYLPNQIVKF